MPPPGAGCDGYFSALIEQRRANPDPDAHDIVSNAINWHPEYELAEQASEHGGQVWGQHSLKMRWDN